MKRVTSMILVVLLFLLPVGCTVEDDGGASTTTTGAPTTTTTQAANQAKLVTADIRKMSEHYYSRTDNIVPSGVLYTTFSEMEDPANEGAQFRVAVEIEGIPHDSDKAKKLVENLRASGMRVELIAENKYGMFYAQGTKSQIEAITTLEPSFGYYLWLAPPWRPEGYSEVYSDVMAAWLDEVTMEEKVRVTIFPAWNNSDKSTVGELWNEDRLFTQAQQQELIDAGTIQGRTQAIGERYSGEKISVFCYSEFNAMLCCNVTKEEILKMVDDPEIRYVDLCSPVG